MERQIGERFDYGGVTLEVVESGPCKGCHFFKGCINCEEHDIEVTGGCGPTGRSDHKSVMFQKVK